MVEDLLHREPVMSMILTQDYAKFNVVRMKMIMMGYNEKFFKSKSSSIETLIRIFNEHPESIAKHLEDIGCRKNKV